MRGLVWIGKWSLALAGVGAFVHWTWPWGLLAIPLVMLGVYVNRDVPQERRARRQFR